jgi:hypothetical protein
MIFKHHGVSYLAAAMLVFAGVSMAAPTGAREAKRLFKEIRVSAHQVEMQALDWEKISEQPAPRWEAYNRQWNMIKPTAETIHEKFNRLETMRVSLTPAEQKELDNAKPLVAGIEGKTTELRTYLDQKYPKQLSNPAYRDESRALARTAKDLIRTAR